jgi:hypothetical protein
VIIEGPELAQDAQKVALVPDQGPVEELPPAGRAAFSGRSEASGFRTAGAVTVP